MVLHKVSSHLPQVGTVSYWVLYEITALVCWATSKTNRAVSSLCRRVCLNNKRSWIKIGFLIHITPAAMEPDNGSLLQLILIWIEGILRIANVADNRSPSDGHKQDIVCVQIQIEYSACVFSFHLSTEVAHFSYPSFSHFAALTSF